MTTSQKIKILTKEVALLQGTVNELKNMRSEFYEMDSAIVTLNVGFQRYMKLFEMIHAFMLEMNKLPKGIPFVRETRGKK